MRPLNIAVAGAGLIGTTHIKLIDQHPSCALAAIIDPMEPARALANSLQTPYFGELDEACKKRGMKLLVVDPRRSDVAKKADVFLQPRPGEDPTILAGMIRVILEEDRVDTDFLAQHVDRLLSDSLQNVGIGQHKM